PRDKYVYVLIITPVCRTHALCSKLDPARDAEQVRLNCEALVTLTHAFLPGMLERKRGGVITVASTAGMQPIPYETVYSASKAFARTFSDALSAELRGRGVRGSVRESRTRSHRVAGDRGLRAGI